MDRVEAIFLVAGSIALVVWAAFTCLPAFRGERVGAVRATEEDLDSRARYVIVVRRSVRGPRALRIVHLVMGMSALAPGALFVLNQVEAVKAAEALESAAQAAEQ
jgi:hypothetical protein